MNIAPFLTQDGGIVFTLTSNGYKLMTLNLVRHLQARKVPWKLCVVCTDAGSYRFLSGEGIPCVKATGLLPDSLPIISPFGSKDFQALNKKKLECLFAFTSNPEVRYGVYMDGDIAVYSDFLPDIRGRLEDAPLYLQCDEQTRVDCSGNPCPNACSGFIAWKYGVPPSIFSLSGPVAQQVWKDCPQDQVFINRMIHHYNMPFATLPRDLYPNGSFASLYGPDSTKKRVAHILHYNYLVGTSKQQKMKINGDWLLPY